METTVAAAWRVLPCVLFGALLALCAPLVSGNNLTEDAKVDPILNRFVLSEDTSVPKMQLMMTMFDHHGWDKFTLGSVNRECQGDMKQYLSDLSKGTLWAVKMNDASGHYGGQFFFGNDYWLGSILLCQELEDPKYSHPIPPFKVAFSVAKISLQFDTFTTPMKRHISVAACLPQSCTPADVKSIFDKSTTTALRHNNQISLEVQNIRRVPGDYRLIDDVKFQIVGGVALVTLVVIIIATMYEAILVSQESSSKNKDAETPGQINHNNNMEVKADSTKALPMKCNAFDNPKKGLKHCFAAEVLLCFSAFSNGRKIFQTSKLPEDSLMCVHGLRFLSVLWVIMVHTYLEVFAIAENKTLRVVTERNFIYQTISNATFSVDTFFFISGLLVSILYFRSSQAKNTKEESSNKTPSVKNDAFKFVMLMAYRFLRLTPAYMFVLGVNEIVIRYFHSNSVFEPTFYDHITCDKYWWRNMLYINTLFPQKDICMLWSWYMSNDTQFYVIAVILLLLAVRSSAHFKVAVGAILVFLVSSSIVSFSIAYKYNYHARIEEPFALFDELYDKPWSRIGPYLVGMMAGWFLFRVNCKLHMSRLVVFLGWLLSISCILSLVYGLGKDGLQLPASAFYASLGHTAWGASLAWITIACCTGYGGLVNHILSFKGFLPFSRLTYCAYLVHPMIMFITSSQMDGPLQLHNGMVVIIYYGNIIASFLMSIAVSLAFEAPVVRLLKIIFRQ